MKATLLLSTLVAPLAFAAPFEAKRIPAEAQWFLHGDLTALREMETGWFMMKTIRSQQAQALAEIENIFEFDPFTDLILFGNGRKDEGAVILSGDIGRDHLEEVIVHADNYETTTCGTATLHHWDDQGKRQHAAFPVDRTVVITGQEELLKLTLDVFAGKKPGLAESPVPLAKDPAILALILLVALWQPSPDKKAEPVTRLPEFKPVSTARLREPVRHEYDALRREAQLTLSLVRSALPSLPLSQENARRAVKPKEQ